MTWFRMSGRIPARVLALAWPLALAGCAVGPGHERPQAAASAGFLRAGGADAAAPDARWWEDMGDAQLTALIDRGLADAPSVAAAEARLRQARAGLAAARAGLLPAISGSAMYAYADLPNNAIGGTAGNIDFFNLGFDAQWEADLWGGKQRAVQASRAQAGEAAARLADTRVMLSAEIARAYAGLRAREASLALLGQRHAAQGELAAIARKRLNGGSGTGQELAGALQAVAHTEGEQAIMAAEVAALRDTLAELTGQQPGAMDDHGPGSIPLPPAQARIGDPAAMLARRPDILAAEARLAAATARIGEAQARRLPAISLMGLVGLGGTSVGDIFDTSQLSVLALPRLTWNFLDFGRAAAGVRGAKAGQEAALADYRASVLAALRDAESALSRFGAARIAFARASQGAVHAAETARLEGLRGQAGAAAPAEVLQARGRAIEARLGEVNARANLTLSYVALAKALGLGWQGAADGEASGT